MLQNLSATSFTPAAARGAGSRQPLVVAVTSGKGGVGKSSISVNLAILMQRMQQRVLLIDADVHLGNVDFILGLRPRYTIADVVRRQVDLDEAIISAPGGMDILPASAAVPELLAMEDSLLRRLAGAFARFQSQYDVVLVDTGAGISQMVLSFVFGADKVMLIATGDPASMADAYAMIKVIRTMDGTMPILMTTNMTATYKEGDDIFKKMNLMVNKFLHGSIEYGGNLLRDDQVAHSVRVQRPFALEYPNGAAAKALRVIYHRLMKMHAPESEQSAHFFERFLKHRKRPLEIQP